MGDIKDLNPELSRWCTPPNFPDYEIKIPFGKKELFLKNFKTLYPGEKFQFKTYTVNKGDTFPKIASLYRVDLEPILEINRLNKKSRLSSGMNLLIPLPKDQGPKPDSLAKKKSDWMGQPLKPSTEMTYTIKKGDSLWTIANETGVNIGSLSRWNNLHPEQKLMPGDKLKIRMNKPSGSLDEPNGKKAGREIIYIVKEGDTLWSIHRRRHVRGRPRLGAQEGERGRRHRGGGVRGIAARRVRRALPRAAGRVAGARHRRGADRHRPVRRPSAHRRRGLRPALRQAAPASANLGAFVYGLPEWQRERIRGAKRIANPGCFATGLQLALLPLLAAGVPLDWVAVSGTTGSSGSGALPSDTTHHPTRANDYRAYKPLVHQHLGEAERLIAAHGATTKVSFVPHSAPLVRGVSCTLHARVPDRAAWVRRSGRAPKVVRAAGWRQ